MRRRRPRPDRESPEQLILQPASAAPKKRARTTSPAAEQAARAYIAKRAKPSVVPGRVKLTFTLELPRELAERLSALAIREGKNLDSVVIDIILEAVAQ